MGLPEEADRVWRRLTQGEKGLTLLEYEIRRLNRHLPKSRKTLRQLRAELAPSVEALDGETLHFKREDLERLAGLVPENYHDSVKLPIVVLRRLELGKGVYTVLGGRFERLLVERLVGLSSEEFDEVRWRREEREVYLYIHHVHRLLSTLRSLVTIGFEAPEVLD